MGLALVVTHVLLPGHEEAFDAHEQQPHTKRYLAERLEHIESFDVDFLDAVAGVAQGIAIP